MNDNNALGAVRDYLATAKGSLAEVHMNTPQDTIVRNGRARRRRYRLTGLAGAIGVAAAAALATTVLLPASHPVSHPVSTQLAAWTVTRQSDGNIDVYIRQLHDPASLQSKLRADGIPASVTFLDQQNPSCRPYPQTQALFKSIYQAQKAAGSGNTILIIHPSALPSGAGVQIGAAVDQQAGDRGLHPAAVNQTIHHSVLQPVHQVAARAHYGVIRVGLVYGPVTGQGQVASSQSHIRVRV